MANFWNFQNIKNAFVGSSRGRDVIVFEHKCPQCGNTESRSLEVGYVRDKQGWRESSIKCSNCRERYDYSFEANGLEGLL